MMNAEVLKKKIALKIKEKNPELDEKALKDIEEIWGIVAEAVIDEVKKITITATCSAPGSPTAILSVQ